MTGAPFPRHLLAGDSESAARALIGAFLVRGNGPNARIGRIVEVEAYVGIEDLASHARFGRTNRNAVMFGPPGVAYVYLVYGMHHCLNVITEAEGRPAALLIRALEPVSGIEEMRTARIAAAGRTSTRRGHDSDVARIGGLPAARLASGPGLVCACFTIDRTTDGDDLCDPGSDLRLEAAPDAQMRLPVAQSPRVGIGYATEPWLSKPWRFFVEGNPAVSGPRVAATAAQ